VSAAVKQGSSLNYAAASALAVERLTVTQSVDAAVPPGPRGALQPITRPVLAQLDGHEGSIHRCKHSTFTVERILAGHMTYRGEIAGK